MSNFAQPPNQAPVVYWNKSVCKQKRPFAHLPNPYAVMQAFIESWNFIKPLMTFHSDLKWRPKNK